MSVLTSSSRTFGDAGYFRIGNEILDIPPESISTSRIVATEEIPTLRTPYPTAKRSGHSRIDITLQWKALAETSSSVADYHQWAQVRNIVSMVRASPFVEVYNRHLAQVLKEKHSSYSSGNRIAVALRQIQVQTHPDIVDCLQCTLVMTVFNFIPYTTDFAYNGDNGQRADADQCSQFALYLSTWRNSNFPNDYDPDFGWTWLQPELTRFNWREYIAVSLLDQNAATLPALAAGYGAAPAAPIQIGPLAGKQDIVAKIVAAAKQAGVDPILALALAYEESALNPSAHNTGAYDDKGHWVQSDAVGVFQLEPATGRSLGVANRWNADQNIAGGIKLLSILSKKYSGSFNKMMQAFSSGEGATDSGRPLTKQDQGVISRTTSLMASFRARYPNLAQGSPATPPTPPASPTPAAAAPQPADLSQNSLTNPDVAGKLAPFLALGWSPDHYTDKTAFLYRPYTIDLDAQETQAMPHQATVVIANNLAQIPLAGYAMPTYQHVAPSSTLVSLTFISKSSTAPGEEPAHPTVQALSEMESMLDAQIIEMKKEFRSAASIHRMQTITVQNKVLNLLGIFSMMVQSIDTDMVPESPDLLQVTVAASVYANVYENRDAWRIHSIGAQTLNAVTAILQGPDIASTAGSKEGQQSLAPLSQYQKDLKARNKATLVAMLQSSQGQQIAPVNFPAGMASWTSQQQTLLQAVQSPPSAVSSANSSSRSFGYGAGSVNLGSALTPVASTFASQNPALIKRFSNTGVMPSYSDYLLVSSAANNPTVTAQVDALVDAAVKAGGTDPIATLYQQYLSYKIQTDPVFSTAEHELEKNPKFASQFQGVTVGPPGQDGANQNHGAYADFGLTNITAQGIDINPAYYFYDHSQDLYNNYQQLTTQLAGTAVQAVQNLNQAQGQNANAVNISDLASQIMLRTQHAVPPPYAMTRAFPTFKLFLMEENNTGLFYAFDDFYSYSAVISMEIIRYQDKPDMAVIQIGNATNLLTHRLHDNSVLGKLDQKLTAPWTIETPQSSDGSTIASQVGVTTTDVVTRSAGNITNLVPGYGAANKRAPYQYYALQTGTKIQIRMGFANNPDLLFPVFTGKVTQIEPGEVMTLTAQSFLLELMDYPGDNMVTGWNGGNPFSSYSGDSEGIMAKILSVGTATHFGHWQMNSTTSDMLKGYNWYVAPAQFAQNFASLKAWATAALTGYDRSAENILVNKTLNADGSYAKANGIMRTYLQERSVLCFLPPTYHIPKDPKFTPWFVIKDIARRYPECIVTVKQYGFPYAADATLVFANPNDWYIARPPLPSEGDLDTVSTNSTLNPVQNQLFTAWWNTQGRTAWTNMARDFNNQTNDFDTVYNAWKNPGSSSALRAVVGYHSDFETEANEISQAVNNGGLSVFQNLKDATLAAAKDLRGQNLIARLASDLLNNDVAYERLRKNTIIIYKELQVYMQTASQKQGTLPGYPNAGDRLQPVRKWHLITSANIVRNGITLNENFHNAVSLCKTTFKASSTIPDQYTRTLDCDPMTIAPENDNWLSGQTAAYAQSFLREEVGKMYRGELELTAVPEIEPFDVIILYDPVAGMSGPIEVESVIHSFTLEGGYTSIVRPRALIVINESASAGILASLSDMLKNWQGELATATNQVQGSNSAQRSVAAASAATTTAGALAAGVAARGAAGALTSGAASGTVAAGTEATVSSITGGVASSAGVQLAADAAASTGTALATGLEVTGEVAGGAAALLGGWGILAVGAAFGAYGAYCLLNDRQTANPLAILPLTRYDRPWVGGVEGWRFTNLAQRLATNFDYFMQYDVYSTIEGFKQAAGIVSAVGQ